MITSFVSKPGEAMKLPIISSQPVEIAVLCCAIRSEYKKLPYTDCYDINRCMTTYAGDNPIVAHPPCRSWSRFQAHQAKPLPGEKELAIRAVALVKRNGGVLEHPAHSRLFEYLDLPLPGDLSDPRFYTIEVWQSWFGYPSKKRTWLLCSKIPFSKINLPYQLTGQGLSKSMVGKSREFRSKTVLPFALFLLELSRRANT